MIPSIAALRALELQWRLLRDDGSNDERREWLMIIAEGTNAPLLGRIALAALNRVAREWMVTSGTSPKLGAIVFAVLRTEELGTMDTHSVDVVLGRLAILYPRCIAGAGLTDVALQRLAAAAARLSHHRQPPDQSRRPGEFGRLKRSNYIKAIRAVGTGPIRDLLQQAYRQRGIELDIEQNGVRAISADQFTVELAQADPRTHGEEWVRLVTAYAARGERGSSLVEAFQQATTACHGVEGTEWLIQPMFDALDAYRRTLGDPDAADPIAWHDDSGCDETTVAARKVLTEFALDHPKSAEFVKGLSEDQVAGRGNLMKFALEHPPSPVLDKVLSGDEDYTSDLSQSEAYALKVIVYHLDLASARERNAFLEFMGYAVDRFRRRLYEQVDARIRNHIDYDHHLTLSILDGVRLFQREAARLVGRDRGIE